MTYRLEKCVVQFKTEGVFMLISRSCFASRPHAALCAQHLFMRVSGNRGRSISLNRLGSESAERLSLESSFEADRSH